MKIVVYSMAHRGDVFPFVPIASELVRRGHDVTFVVPREFHPVLAAEPFRCVHSGTDFSPVELDEHGAFLRRWGMKMGGAVTLRLYFGEFTVPHLEALFTAVDAELADADLLVSHPAASLVGAMACERRGIPWIVGDLFPMLVPTATGPPSGMPDLGGTVNRAMWRLGRSRLVDPLTSRRAFVSFRRRLGLATDRRWNVVDARLSPYHNLALVSAHYVAPAVDWPSNYRLVGFTSWSGPDAGRLPEEVERFLDDGPPPVAVTLGTSGATARPDVFERVADALDEISARGVFLTSNAAVTDRLRAAIQPRHGVWPFVPLAPLLPRTCGLVQSGAHGTNAIALEAGVPSVVVPCLFDQLWHARRQDELGTGIWARRRRHIPNAVQRLLQDSSLGEQAQAMSAQLATEHGTHTACNEIEAFMSSA